MVVLLFTACSPAASEPDKSTVQKQFDSLVDSTLQEIDKQPDNYAKGYGYVELANVMLDQGRQAQALELAKRRQGPYWFIPTEAIKRLAARGEFDAALKLMGTLEDVGHRTGMLVHIAGACLDAKDKRAEEVLDKAMRQELSGRATNEHFLASMGLMYARLGKREKALAAIAPAVKRLARDRHGMDAINLAEIVFQVRLALSVEEAIAGAGQADSSSLVPVACKLARDGKDELAAKAAAKCHFRSHGIWAMTEVAVIQARAGRRKQALASLDQAKAWLDEIPPDQRTGRELAFFPAVYEALGQRDQAQEAAEKTRMPGEWAKLARQAAAADKNLARQYIAKALSLADALPNTNNKALALCDAAVAQMSVGDPNEARRTLARAADLARGLAEKAPASGCAYLLMEIGSQQRNAGDEEAGMASLRQAVKFHGRNHVALREAVTVLVGERLYAMAVETAATIPLSSPRQVAYQCISRAQGRQGRQEEAFGWIKSIADPQDRAFALSGLSGGLRARRATAASAGRNSPQ